MGRKRTDQTDRMMVKLNLQPCPRNGADRPSHPCQHALPNPDPVSHHAHLFCSRSRGIAVELVLSEPGPARSRAIRRVLLCVQGICGSHRCAHACSCDRVRACACAIALVGRPDHARGRVQIRHAHAHYLAGDSRKPRLRRPRRKSKSGRETVFQMCVPRP